MDGWYVFIQFLYMIKISVHSIIRHFMIYIIMYRMKLIYFFCINYAKLSHIFVFSIIPHFILILIFFILFLRTVLLTFSPFQFILCFLFIYRNAWEFQSGGRYAHRERYRCRSLRQGNQWFNFNNNNQC